MNIFRATDAPFLPADPRSFTGPAHTSMLADSSEATPVHVYHVRFESGARTHWHSHSGPQWLFVTEGRIRVQVAGQPYQDIETGDAVVIAPNERHWHGAVPGHRGVHLAVNLNAVTTWLEGVIEAEYCHAP